MRIAGGTQTLNVVDQNLCGSVFDDVNLTGARFHNTKMQDVTIEESCIAGMRINGILVTDLLELYDAAQAAGSNNG
ncbi:MAG: pentapeptide repeat-containing protein [Mesorhizobium sp.]